MIAVSDPACTPGGSKVGGSANTLSVRLFGRRRLFSVVLEKGEKLGFISEEVLFLAECPSLRKLQRWNAHAAKAATDGMAVDCVCVLVHVPRQHTTRRSGRWHSLAAKQLKRSEVHCPL